VPQRPQYPFTDGIGLWTVRWGLQHVQAQVADAPVQGLGEDAVTVMDEEAVPMIRRERFPQLLQGPLRRRMSCDVDMEQSAAPVFDDDKYLENAEGCRHGDTKVAGHDRLGMIPNEGRPSLGLHAFVWPPIKTRQHILADGAWRDAEAEFEEQLVGDTLLAPPRLVLRHLVDNRLQLHRNPWPSRTRLPAPEQPESFPMPAQKGVGLYNR
jgi:hypothetical protein